MKVSAVERGKYLVSGAKWSEKTCNNQNALLLHTWLINTLMGSSQITRINVGKVQTQMLTLYVHYCLSSAPVSFQTQKPPGEENIMVQFKTSVWPPETQLWIVRCLLWNIQWFLYLHILELGHWCGCLVAYKWKCYVTKDTQCYPWTCYQGDPAGCAASLLGFCSSSRKSKMADWWQTISITGKQLTNCSVSENSLDNDRASYSIITALFPQCRKQNGGRSGSRTFTVAT